MSTPRTVARNMIANWLGMATQLVIGFVTAPFLVRHLGHDVYGWWILIGSLTGYSWLLDFGVGTSAVRNMTYYRAKGDREGVNAVFNTAWVLLGGMAGMMLLGTLLLLPFFPRWFHVPDDQVNEVCLALVLFGLNLVVSFGTNVLNSTLWSLQRFDVLNAIAIPVVVLRACLTFYYIGQGYGLAALAVITLLTTLLNIAALAVCCFWLDPGLRLRRRYVQRQMAAKLGNYGIWFLFLSMERPVGQLFVPSLIGIWLGPRLMTLHSFPARLMAYASSIMTSGTQVLTPVATTMHAKNRHTEQQELVLEGSKYCCALGLYFLCLFLWLGQPLFQLWVPSLDDSAQQLLVILALGELLPMSQWINYGVILGKGRHKVMAWISIFELIATISLAWVLSGPYGLVGICAAVAGTGALCRGICQAVYCCWLVGVSLTEYLTRAFVLPMVSAAAPGVGLFLLTTWNKPNTWLELGLYGVIFTVVYLICGAFVLLGSDRLRLWAQMLRDRWTDSGIPLAASPSVTPVEAAPTPGVERNGQGNQTHEYPVHVARTDA